MPGGGGYGGAGGSGSSVAGGGTYGSIVAPLELGSGGGQGRNANGGAGGGALRLTVGGTLQVEGESIGQRSRRRNVHGL